MRPDFFVCACLLGGAERSIAAGKKKRTRRKSAGLVRRGPHFDELRAHECAPSGIEHGRSVNGRYLR
jgi:hypothetical protein